ncbi:hypothetical protein [Haloferax sp. DFSO60]|uniref:hypothetical protein n=1 Tax=Haloferax sp. DFSO60 TaxID=3388652 RepID=UPI003979229A
MVLLSDVLSLFGQLARVVAIFFVAGFVLVSVTPNTLDQQASYLNDHSLASAGNGFVFLVACGVVLGLLSTVSNALAGVGVVFIYAAFVVGAVVAAVSLGIRMLPTRPLRHAFVAGAAVMTIVGLVPLAGQLFVWFLSLAGIGTIVVETKQGVR